MRARESVGLRLKAGLFTAGDDGGGGEPFVTGPLVASRSPCYSPKRPRRTTKNKSEFSFFSNLNPRQQVVKQRRRPAGSSV